MFCSTDESEDTTAAEKQFFCWIFWQVWIFPTYSATSYIFLDNILALESLKSLTLYNSCTDSIANRTT
jgi:hypothetical protein